LGLALVRRIAEWNGGSVRAENRAGTGAGGGRGARFVVTFPIAV